jgi:hypothetical protein
MNEFGMLLASKHTRGDCLIYRAAAQRVCSAAHGRLQPSIWHMPKRLRHPTCQKLQTNSSVLFINSLSMYLLASFGGVKSSSICSCFG